MKNVNVNQDVEAEVQSLLLELDGFPKTKLAAMVVKNFKADTALTKFLKGDFGRGLKLFTDKEYRAKLIESLTFGLVDIKQKQALVIAILKSSVEDAIAAKMNEITKNGLVALSDEHQELVAAKMEAYEKFIRHQVDAVAIEIGLMVGALDVIHTEEKVPA